MQGSFRRDDCVMKTGICSITFRSLRVEELVALASEAGLDAVEWGSDVHVPPGDVEAARRARQATLDAGLEVSSYGSYYSPLDADGVPEDFEPVLESALALGTDTIRIWAGKHGSGDAPEGHRKHLVDETRRIAALAEKAGVKLGFEFHTKTLMDSNESALQLLEEINQPNVYSYWQPPYWRMDMDYRFEGIGLLGDRLLNLHVFQWDFDDSGEQSWVDSITRLPLSAGEEEWSRYLSAVWNHNGHALLEFTRNDSAGQFLQDAATLKHWIKKQDEQI